MAIKTCYLFRIHSLQLCFNYKSWFLFKELNKSSHWKLISNLTMFSECFSQLGSFYWNIWRAKWRNNSFNIRYNFSEMYKWLLDNGITKLYSVHSMVPKQIKGTPKEKFLAWQVIFQDFEASGSMDLFGHLNLPVCLIGFLWVARVWFRHCARAPKLLSPARLGSHTKYQLQVDLREHGLVFK